MNSVSYENLFGSYMDITKFIPEKSMLKAAEELRDDQDDDKDVMVSVSGTWQRCGHNSHNGVATTVGVATGKALDCLVMATFHFRTYYSTSEFCQTFLQLCRLKERFPPHCLRIVKSNRRDTTHSKQTRKPLRAIKKDFGNKKEQQKGLLYDRGEF